MTRREQESKLRNIYRLQQGGRTTDLNISCGIAIWWNNKILLEHPTNAKWFGTYSIPKGNLNKGEDVLQAALRETKEEVGIHIPIKFLTEEFKSTLKVIPYTSASGKVYKEVYYYTLKIDNLSDIGLGEEKIKKGNLQLEEVDWAGFVSIEDAKKRITSRQMIILEDYEKERGPVSEDKKQEGGEIEHSEIIEYPAPPWAKYILYHYSARLQEWLSEFYNTKEGASIQARAYLQQTATIITAVEIYERIDAKKFKKIKSLYKYRSGGTLPANITTAPPEFLKETELSNESFVWLHNWSWSERGLKTWPSDNAIKEFRKYIPAKPVTLYRGTKDTLKNESNKKLVSYSYQRGYAESIAEIGEFGEDDKGSGYLIERVIEPKDILVDISLIPNYNKYFTNEVIVIRSAEMQEGGQILDLPDLRAEYPDKQQTKYYSRYFSEKENKWVGYIRGSDFTTFKKNLLSSLSNPLFTSTYNFPAVEILEHVEDTKYKVVDVIFLYAKGGKVTDKIKTFGEAAKILNEGWNPDWTDKNKTYSPPNFIELQKKTRKISDNLKVGEFYYIPLPGATEKDKSRVLARLFSKEQDAVYFEVVDYHTANTSAREWLYQKYNLIAFNMFQEEMLRIKDAKEKKKFYEVKYRMETESLGSLQVEEWVGKLVAERLMQMGREFSSTDRIRLFELDDNDNWVLIKDWVRELKQQGGAVKKTSAKERVKTTKYGCGCQIATNKDNTGQPLPKMDNGGMVYGPSHADGGVPYIVQSTKQPVELEGKEMVVKDTALESNKKLVLTGTPKDIINKLNETADPNYVPDAPVDVLKGGEAVINKTNIADKNVYKVEGTPREIASCINEKDGHGVNFRGSNKPCKLRMIEARGGSLKKKMKEGGDLEGLDLSDYHPVYRKKGKKPSYLILVKTEKMAPNVLEYYEYPNVDFERLSKTSVVDYLALWHRSNEQDSYVLVTERLKYQEGGKIDELDLTNYESFQRSNFGGLPDYLIITRAQRGKVQIDEHFGFPKEEFEELSKIDFIVYSAIWHRPKGHKTFRFVKERLKYQEGGNVKELDFSNYSPINKETQYLLVYRTANGMLSTDPYTGYPEAFHRLTKNKDIAYIALWSRFADKEKFELVTERIRYESGGKIEKLDLQDYKTTQKSRFKEDPDYLIATKTEKGAIQVEEYFGFPKYEFAEYTKIDFITYIALWHRPKGHKTFQLVKERLKYREGGDIANTGVGAEISLENYSVDEDPSRPGIVALIQTVDKRGTQEPVMTFTLMDMAEEEFERQTKLGEVKYLALWKREFDEEKGFGKKFELAKERLVYQEGGQIQDLTNYKGGTFGKRPEYLTQYFRQERWYVSPHNTYGNAKATLAEIRSNADIIYSALWDRDDDKYVKIEEWIKYARGGEVDDLSDWKTGEQIKFLVRAINASADSSGQRSKVLPYVREKDARAVLASFRRDKNVTYIDLWGRIPGNRFARIEEWLAYNKGGLTKKMQKAA